MNLWVIIYQSKGEKVWAFNDGELYTDLEVVKKILEIRQKTSGKYYDFKLCKLEEITDGNPKV